MALTPSPRASRATASASAWLLRELTTTCAPSPASFKTVARPMFRPDPVTSATLPSSLPMSESSPRGSLFGPVHPLVVQRARHRAELVAELSRRLRHRVRLDGLGVLPDLDDGEV